MESVYHDPVFGEMSYQHRWYKKESLSLFGRVWPVTVAAKAYSGKPITDRQRESYLWFSQNREMLNQRTTEEIIAYVDQNCEALAATWPGARMLFSAEDVSQVVHPTTLLFQQDGTTLLLMECSWDKEHGLAVELAPTFAIGSQDDFL